MLYAFLLFAQEKAAEKPPDGGPLGGLGGMLLPIGAMLLLFYFMMILPARKEKKQREALLAQLKRNDKVITNAGIIGVVHSVDDKDDEVTLKLDEGRVKVLRSSIVRILTPKDQPKEPDSTAIKK